MNRKYFFITCLLLLCMPVLLYSLDFYWDNPEELVPDGVGFTKTVTTNSRTVVMWQESEMTGEEEGETYLSVALTDDGYTWEKHRRVLGPFSFIGKEIQFYSHVVDEDGRIVLAVSTPDNAVRVFSSTDGGAGFSELTRTRSFATRVTPRLFRRNGRGYILFITQEFEIAQLSFLGIYYSVSVTGEEFSEFRPLVDDPELTGTFLPSYTVVGGREYVVFQAFITGAVSSFQLYLKYTDNGGITWSNAVPLTDFEEEWAGSVAPPERFDNQRPFIVNGENGLALTWERRYTGNAPQVYYAELTSDGRLRRVPEPVTRGSRICQNPRIFTLEGQNMLIWFDNRAGENRVILAWKEGLFWEEQNLTLLVPGNSTFPSPVVRSDDLYVVWENETEGRKGLLYLKPDRTVSKPSVRTVDFAPGRRTRQDEFTIRWTSPEDSSGIAGYSYSWDRRPDSDPPRRLMLLDRDRVAEAEVTEDGLWYFHLAAQDYAGNWSDTVHVPFFRDTTPPGTVEFETPQKDEQGYLLSNTGTITWKPPPEEDVAGYTYRLQYLAPADWDGPPDEFDIRPPPDRIMTEKPVYSFRNEDNGLWALTVAAVDVVGNVGEPVWIPLRMNKYVPVTYITRINAETDELGRVELNIIGRGFSVGGLISRVILDMDGREPYDYVFEGGTGLYTVLTDRVISGPVLEDIDPGDYRIGLVHPKRGLYFSRQTLTLESSGTVKFGDFDAAYRTIYSPPARSRFSIPFIRVLFFVVMGFLVVMFVLSSLRLVRVTREGKYLKAEAIALLTGEVLEPGKKKKERIESMRKKGMGLRVKFVLLATTLVLIVVLMVAVPLAMVTTNNQQRILAKGLEQRVNVLLESLAGGGRVYLRAQDLLEVGALPDQMSAMDEATFVTITGEPAPDAEGDLEVNDYVWATNEPEILEKTGGRGTVGGAFPARDELSGVIAGLSELINSTARGQFEEIDKRIAELTARAEPLGREYAKTLDEETGEALNRIYDEITILNNEKEKRLLEIGNITGSVPEYDPENLDPDRTNYVFYKPIVFSKENQDFYFRGAVRLGVSTRAIIEQIDESRRQLLLIILAVAVAAVLLGIAGALLLATIIIRPIRLLVQGVEVIRDTDDKEELRDHVIDVKTSDELSLLANTINQMTVGLVEAAKQNKDLTLGKEIQKKFIPLKTDTAGGRKLSTGTFENDAIEIFGYYEGADALSGDYFDQVDLQNGYHAFIKCDVAGHGASASLIMVEVATIFTSHFRRLVGKKPNIDVAGLVNTINELLEERQFTGRFAAMTVGILEEKTGKLHICHAGDNMIHIYRRAQRKVTVYTLPEAPATGIFSKDLVDMRGGYQQVMLQLDKGDILLLFTDGLEESHHLLRDRNFKVTSYKNLPPDLLEKDKKFLDEGYKPIEDEETKEEFDLKRVHEVIESAMQGRNYSLKRRCDLVIDKPMEFDFSSLEGDIGDMVIAVMSVEKMYRLFPDPAATDQDRIHVDRVIADFLKEHFRDYEKYLGEARRIEDEQTPEYVWFKHLKEDEQDDDLTIMAIRRK